MRLEIPKMPAWKNRKTKLELTKGCLCNGKILLDALRSIGTRNPAYGCLTNPASSKQQTSNHTISSLWWWGPPCMVQRTNKEETHQPTIHGPLISKKTRGQWNTCWWCWWQPEIQKGQKTLVPNGAKAPWSLNGTSTTNLPQLVSSTCMTSPTSIGIKPRQPKNRWPTKNPGKRKKNAKFSDRRLFGGGWGGQKGMICWVVFFGKFRFSVKWWVMKHGIFCTVAFLIHGVIDVIHGQYLDM